MHGVAIRPGHPFVLARASLQGRVVPLLGIPGYPVSAALCADLFLRPAVERLAQRDPPEETAFEVTLTRKLFSPLGEEEYVRAVAARVGERLVATPLRRGAGVMSSLSRANCLLVVPRLSEGFAAGTKVRARALRPLAAIERTLLAVGSHDVALDLLAGRLALCSLELVSANVGSIAGLVALNAGATHLAGTHVLDAASATYNEQAVRRYPRGSGSRLSTSPGAGKGWSSRRAIRLGLQTIEDIVRKGARYVNRQRDAGTRMLFDAQLRAAGIAPAEVVGYYRLEFTHLAVAALVKDGSADCGMAILAAAQALGCDFVPLAWEPFELALPADRLDDAPIAAVRELLAVSRFGPRSRRSAGMIERGGHGADHRTGRRAAGGCRGAGAGMRIELFGMARDSSGRRGSICRLPNRQRSRRWCARLAWRIRRSWGTLSMASAAP